MRRDFRFSTGKRVTARDFAHTVNRVLSPILDSPEAEGYSDVVGAQAVREGKARTASGVVARGDILTISLTRRDGVFMKRIGLECVLPEGTPVDAEGVTAPVPAAGPYYVSQFVPGRSVVLERNPLYRGERPHHVDRFVVDLTLDAPTILDAVERGDLDWGWLTTADYGARAEALKQRYGVNRSRFFVVPGTFLRMFVLNTESPLFRTTSGFGRPSTSRSTGRHCFASVGFSRAT